MTIDLSKVRSTRTSNDKLPPYSQQLTDLSGHVVTKLLQYKSARTRLENLWRIFWATYIPTSNAQEFIRQNVYEVFGNVNTQWRHRLDVGEGFETVETIVALLWQSLFPTAHWLDFESLQPGLRENNRLLKYFMLDRFDSTDFYPQFEHFLRQMVILGTSVMALPWVDNDIEYKTLDMFDVFLDPEADVRDGALIRRVRKNRTQFLQDIRNKKYSMSEYDMVTTKPNMRLVMQGETEVEFSKDTQVLHYFMGFQVDPYTWHDRLTCYEYWGDIELPYITYHNVVATVFAGKLVRFEQNKYKERPFVIGQYTPVVKQVYGIGAIQSALGSIQTVNNTVNQMLDGIELAVNPMWTVVQDGITDTEEIYSEPGKKIPVGDHNSVRPMDPPANNFALSNNTIAYLASRVNEVTGTGPLIGVGQPRGGERVTAEEIATARQAGGNRLSKVHKRLETEVLLKVVRKAFVNYQQFYKGTSTIRLPLTQVGSYGYYEVDRALFRNDVRIKARGSDFVIERQTGVDSRVRFLELLKAFPEAAQLVNLEALILDIMYHWDWGRTDPELYLRSSQEQPEQQQQFDEMLPAMEQMLLANEMADGGQTLAQNTFGVDLPSGMTITGAPDEPA